MKKFASIVLCVMLVLSMAVTGLVSVSAASTGTITLHKNIDRTTGDTTTGLDGATFSVYKILSLNDEGLYEVANDLYSDTLTGADGVLTDLITGATTGTAGYLTYGSTDELEEKISDLETIIKEYTITADDTQTTAGGGIATFSNLAYGVYLVIEDSAPDGYTKSTPSFLVALNAEQTSVDAYPKNSKVDVDKKIGDATSSSSTADYAIGSTVPFIITSTIPNYSTVTLDGIIADDETNGTTVFAEIPYYFHDTLSSGLTLDSDSIGVTIKKGETKKTLTLETDCYYKAGTDNDFYIVIPMTSIYDPDNSINFLGGELTITYEAKLNENAVVTTGNKNDLDLYYTDDPTTYDPEVYWSNNSTPTDPDPDPDPDDPDNPTPDPEEPDVDPVVYTYEFDLTKTLNGETYTNDDSTQAVKFTLYKDSVKEGNEVYSEKNDDGTYTVRTDGGSGAVYDKFTVNTNGTLKIKGLDAGTYVLKEVQTLSGYTLLTSPITIVVTGDTDSTTGNLNGEVIAYYNNGKEDDASTENVDESKTYIQKEDTGIFELTVNNAESQFDLPLTGGMGLLIYTLGGAVVLAAAVIIFANVRKKKTSK